MNMNLTQLTAIIEAVLFAAGEPVETSELARICDIDEDTLILALERMQEKYNEENGGICLVQAGSTYQLSTKKEYYEYIVKLVEPKEQNNLSNAAMETLSIVAYNQPVTRSSIEFIRGVNSDSAVNKLVQRGLIEECGRLDTPGKPLLYKTTSGFLKTFGLKQINDLPDIDNIPLQLTFYDMKEEE